jgi:murein DD-endopeptidase MepM/ murein hydrolase activator NlpD
MGYDISTSRWHATRNDLREELKVLDDVISETRSVSDLEFLKQRRGEFMDDYLDAMYGTFESMPAEEQIYIDKQILQNEKIQARINYFTRVEAQPVARTTVQRNSFGSTLRKVAMIGGLMFVSLGQSGYNISDVVEAETYRHPATIAPIEASAPAADVILEYKYEQAMQGTYATWFVTANDTALTSLKGKRNISPKKGHTDHAGIDVRAQQGDKAVAIADVQITYRVGTEIAMRTPGDTVIVYNHVSSKLNAGDFVARGASVGRVVNEGESHLHVEMYAPGAKQLDPYCALDDGVREHLIEKISEHPTPTGLRRRSGTTVREKLERSCQMAAIQYALTQL